MKDEFEQEDGSTEITNVLSKFSEKDLKSIVNVFCAKPESITRTFSHQLLITKDEIDLLNKSIQEKLKTHQIMACNLLVDVSTSSNKFYEFTSFKAFYEYDWKVTEVTTSISLKWSFYVRVDGHNLPQPHTLSVRLFTEVKPLNLLQAIFSQDEETAQSLELSMCSATCRVDYINAVIANELIAKVENWLDQSPKVIEENKLFKTIREHDVFLSRCLKYLLLFFSLVVFITLYSFLFSKHYLSDVSSSFIYWSAYAFIFYMLDHTTNVIRESFNTNLRLSANGSMVFRLTSGDVKIIEKNARIKNKAQKGILLNLALNILINIICGIITYYLLPHS